MAAKKFEEWHEFPPDKRTPTKIPRKLSTELVWLGECDGIMYNSDKWHAGKWEKYIHETTAKKKPALLYDPGTGIFLIVGGAWKVTADGIVG